MGFPIGPNRVLIATGGLVAATIRHHNGRFYVICTNVKTEGGDLVMNNFYVTSEDVGSGDWSDPIWFDFKGIDTSLYFDHDSRVYVQGSWREGSLAEWKCSIMQVEIDIATGKHLSDVKELWLGFAGKDDAEGPHIYKKDDYYYLLTAEAGTFEHHMIAMARSRDIWGPYESYEANPVLTAFGTSEYIQATGHGDLFQDKTGNWWCVCLGTRDDAGGRCPLSRETFLTPVEWPKNGWPCIAHPRMDFKRASALIAPSIVSSLSASARVGDLYVRGYQPRDYAFSADNKTLTLTPKSFTLDSDEDSPTFIGQRQRQLSSTATVSLNNVLAITLSTTKAGLSLYKDDFRHASVYYDFKAKAVCFRKLIKLAGEAVSTEDALELSSPIEFRIKASVKAYDFAYRLEKDEWTSVAIVDTKEMTALEFTGPIFGIFATAEDGSKSSSAVFKNFSITNV